MVLKSSKIAHQSDLLLGELLAHIFAEEFLELFDDFTRRKFEFFVHKSLGIRVDPCHLNRVQ